MNTPLTPPPPPSGSAAARLKDRLLHPWTRPADEASAHPEQLPVVSPPRPLGFPSRIAEFLLVFRLRARKHSYGDPMERALKMVLVTCKNWFSRSDKKHSPPPSDPRGKRD